MREVVICRDMMAALLAMSAEEGRRCLLALYEWQRTGVAEPPRLEGARIVFDALLERAQAIEDERLSQLAHAEEVKARKRSRDRESVKKRRNVASCRSVSSLVVDDSQRPSATASDSERQERKEDEKERTKEKEEEKKELPPLTPQGEGAERPLTAAARFVVDEKHRPEWLREEMFPPFLAWLEYKRSRRESYRGEVGTKRAYHRLVDLSLGDPATAQRVVDFCIAQGYKGLFAPKDTTINPGQGGGMGRRLPTNQDVANELAKNLGRY